MQAAFAQLQGLRRVLAELLDTLQLSPIMTEKALERHWERVRQGFDDLGDLDQLVASIGPADRAQLLREIEQLLCLRELIRQRAELSLVQLNRSIAQVREARTKMEHFVLSPSTGHGVNVAG